MKILEQFCKGKRADRLCEDGWVVTADFAAVVDGSTSKIKVEEGQESPGHLAMRLVCDAIRQLPREATKEETLETLTRTLASDNTYTHLNYRPTCSAVIFSLYYREVWFVGDCQARWNGKTYRHDKLVDAILTDIRCQAIRYYLKHGYTVADIRQQDKGRAFILDALRDQLYFQNDPDAHNPFRYTVIDGQPILSDKVPSIPVGDAKELVLASDGYPTLTDSLQETEDKLDEVLQKDPLCIHENPATKCLVDGNCSFDDRTFLRIEL